MKSRNKFTVINKYNRIWYIKTELDQLVNKVLFKNTYATKNILMSNLLTSRNKKPEGSKAKQRLFCSITNSPKIVTKKYRLGRFAFAFLSNNGKIGGLNKRGW